MYLHDDVLMIIEFIRFNLSHDPYNFSHVLSFENFVISMTVITKWCGPLSGDGFYRVIIR